jgi:hypothetical protein
MINVNSEPTRRQLIEQAELYRIDLDRLTAEVQRLRAALEEIIQDSFSVYAIQVARAALNKETRT